MTRRPVVHQHLVARNELEAIGLRVIEAFNARDLESALALAHPRIVVAPSRLYGSTVVFQRHDGLAAWGQTMTHRGLEYEILLSSIRTVERRTAERRHRRLRLIDLSRGEHRRGHRRHLDAHKLVLMGDMYLGGDVLTPWAALLVIQDGLVIRHRSYLSSAELLEQLGVLNEPLTGSQLLP